MAEYMSFLPSGKSSHMPLSDYRLLEEKPMQHPFHSELMKKYKTIVSLETLGSIKEYNLIQMAAEVGINIPSRDNNKAAEEILRECIRGHSYKTGSTLKIKGRSIGELQRCYCDPYKNMGDASVTDQNDSDVVYVEVHSDTFVHTARKTVLLLFHYIRLLKCFGVTCPKVHAFVFPCKEVEQCAVQVTMQYDSSKVEFCYSVKCLRLSDIRSALQGAYEQNEETLSNTARTISDNYNHYAVYLTQLEVNAIAANQGHEYTNCRLAKCYNGILIMTDRYCLKKPLYKISVSNLMLLCWITNSSFIHYTRKELGFFSYEKLPYGPLTDNQAKSCCAELVTKMENVFNSLESEGICHSDVRLPNICFNDTYTPVLIDFDFCDFQANKKQDIIKFGSELLRLFPGEADDEFIKQLAQGDFNQSLLAGSIIQRGHITIEQVIGDRM